MTPEKIIEAYGRLLARAMLVVDGAPYWSHCFEGDRAWLTITDDTATLSWPEVERGYEDSYSIETRECEFDKYLLTISDADLKTWKIEQQTQYDRQQKINEQKRRLEHEAELLRQYGVLKAHFEGKS